MTVQISLARLCLVWEQCMHLPAEPETIHKFCQTKEAASVNKQLKFFLTVFPEPGVTDSMLPLRSCSNLAGLQASCRSLHVEMIPSRQDCGRPFRSGEYDPHARIRFGYLTQQTLLQATGETALKHQQQVCWPVSGGKYGKNEKAKMS